MEPKLYKIFTRDLCWYCDKAKEMLNSYGLEYTEYNIELEDQITNKSILESFCLLVEDLIK